MKLKKVYLLLSLFLVSNLFYIESAKTKQLFDMIGENGKNKAETPQKSEEPKHNSIFDSVDGDKEPEPINFNQLNEKATSEKAKKSSDKASLFSQNESESEEREEPVKNNIESAEKLNHNQQNAQKVNESQENTAVANTKTATEVTVPGMGHPAKTFEHTAHNTPQPKKENTPHEEARSASNHEEKIKHEAKLNPSSNNVRTLEEPNPNKNLQKHVTALIEMNERLLKKIHTHNKIHKKFNENHQRMISFIQNYEGDIKNLKHSYQDNQILIDATLSKKDEEFKKLYKQSEDRYEDLEDKFKDFYNQIHQIKNQKQKTLKDLGSEAKLANVNIENSLIVHGEAKLNKVNAKEIDLGTIRIGSNEIAINDANAKITFGQESLSVAELFENMKAVKAILDVCGNNFENCIRKEEQLHEKQFDQQREILESLKNLRMQTAEILNNHKKKLR